MSCHVTSGCCPEGPWGPRSLGTNHTLAVPCPQVKGNFSQSQGKKEQRGQASPGHPATLGPWPILPLLSSPWTPKGPGQDRAGRNGASPGQAVSSPKGGSWARKTEEGGVVLPYSSEELVSTAETSPGTMGLVVSGGPTSREPHFAAAPRATLVSVSMFPVKPKHAAGQQCQGEHWAQGAKKMRVSWVRESPPGRRSHPTLRGAPQGPGPQSSWKEGPPEPTGTEKQGACCCLPTRGPKKSLEWPPNQHGYWAPRCLPSGPN